MNAVRSGLVQLETSLSKDELDDIVQGFQLKGFVDSNEQIVRMIPMDLGLEMVNRTIDKRYI